jgi:arylsulfatase A-like enzyme
MSHSTPFVRWRPWHAGEVWWWWSACRSGEGEERPPPPALHSAPTTPVHDSAPGTPPTPPPNVLLVVLDDVGTDRLGVYGNPDARTPTLDALAREGRWFRSAWGYPVCSPARAALVTGRHAPRTGYGENAPTGSYALDPSQLTLAELLASAGFDTAFAGKWHLESEGSTLPFAGPTAHGWGWYAGSRGNLEGYFGWDKVQPDGTVARSTTYATTDTTDDAIGRLGALREPWLLTVAYNAAHGPLHEPPRELYTGALTPADVWRVAPVVDAMTEALDRELGRLLAAMSPELRARTLIVVVGDNGDLLDGDVFSPADGKVSLTEGGVGVPFVVNGPQVGRPGPSDALVSVVDVFPTLAALAGLDVRALPGVLHPDEPLALDGRSLLAALADPDAPHHELLWTGRVEPAGPPPWAVEEQAVRDDHHALWIDRDGAEHLFPYGPSGQGEELPASSWTPREIDAAARLRDGVARLRADMVFDAR